MPAKTALIVDDSKTAQFKLKRILQQYDLRIDLAYSAEDALSYLSYRIPDIIFMDHSMRGMNGLEAVKIMKSNRATATIPVAMYTDESGDDYVARAREAGAIDVLSKDVMTEADIDRTVKRIGVSRRQLETPPITHSDTDAHAHAVDTTSEPLIQVRDQVAKSLEIHQGHVRREIQDNTRVMLNRFMRELRSLRDELSRDAQSETVVPGAASATEHTEIQPPVKPTPTTRFQWSQIAIGGLAAITLFSLVLAYSLKQENRALQARTLELIELIGQSQREHEGLESMDDQPASVNANVAETLSSD